MARKSNKTEHVLKLITKDEELLESLNEKEEPAKESEQEQRERNEHQPAVEVSVKPNEEQELKYEAKLKIEIKPEIEVKAKDSVNIKETEALPPDDPAESSLIEKHHNLVNIAEIIANEKIGLVMERMKVCSCSICVNDVLALTLNSLPTKYVTTDAGKQYFQLDMYKKQYETDVLAALTKACVRVKASPRHS
jgi:Late competence development protein ComFB.